MYKFVYLLVFCSLSVGICEYVNVTVDIKLSGNNAVECTNNNPQENLMVGDDFRLVANLPHIEHTINYMGCYYNSTNFNRTNVKVVDACNQTETQCFSNIIRFNKEQEGKWECSFFMNITTGLLQPIKLHMGQNYTSPTCLLEFKAVDKLWFTGLDPSRRKIIEMSDHSGFKYKYTYETGERLNISCQSNHDFNKNTFIFENIQGRKLESIAAGKQFEKLADSSLNETKLFCYTLMEKDPPKQYAIQLDLQSKTDKFWFSGMNLSRTTIRDAVLDSTFTYVYTYIIGERLNISCQSNPDFEIWRFRHEVKASDPYAEHGPTCSWPVFQPQEVVSCANINSKNYTNITHLEEKQCFNKVADASLNNTMLRCYLRNRSNKRDVQLYLQFETGPYTPQPTTAKLITNTTRATIPGFEPSKEAYTFEISTKEKHFSYNFSEPRNISIKCIYPNDKFGNYIVSLFDGGKEVPSKKVSSESGNSQQAIAWHNFTLSNVDKTFLCQATEKTTTGLAREFKTTIDFKYEPIKNETTVPTPTTKDPETTIQSEKFEAGNVQSFLDRYWRIIVIGCAVLVTICVVAYCIKMLCARKTSQPPDDYVNLTNDRGIVCPSQTTPNRTMPKMESNYCNPKDTQGRNNNIDPNYSEAKEAQIMCEGLYAELNRPEDTYAEPYINKSEVYAQPIPKAQRPKKEDPNYGNVFGQDYVNSRK